MDGGMDGSSVSFQRRENTSWWDMSMLPPLLGTVRVACLEGGVGGTQICLCGSQAGLLRDHPLAVRLQPWCSLPPSPCCKPNTEHFCSTRKLHPDDLWVRLWKRQAKFLLDSYWKQKSQNPKEKSLYLFRRSNARFNIFFTFSS